jgi:hypothetical protein
MTEWGIDTLFNPGKRHLDEEKRRLQSTREEVGDSSGGKRVDLDSGRIVIGRKRIAPESPSAAAAAEDGATTEADSADGATAADGAADGDAATEDASSGERGHGAR